MQPNSRPLRAGWGGVRGLAGWNHHDGKRGGGVGKEEAGPPRPRGARGGKEKRDRFGKGKQGPLDGPLHRPPPKTIATTSNYPVGCIGGRGPPSVDGGSSDDDEYSEYSVDGGISEDDEYSLCDVLPHTLTSEA